MIKLKFSATRNLAEPQHAARKGVDIALAGDGYSSWITQFRWQNQPHCLLSRKTSQSHAKQITHQSFYSCLLCC
ncbi:hypothetical protein [Sphingobium xenophagum]